MKDFRSPASRLVRERCSCRSYAKQEISPAKQQALENFLDKPGQPIFGACVRFCLIDFGPKGPGRFAGTYGMIKGARYFMAGAVKSGERAFEDFAYVFERIILKATDLGLATCWIGASLNRAMFAQKLGLGQDETLPAVSPVGYPTKRRSLTDSVARAAIGASSRKPWHKLFFEHGFDKALSKDRAGDFAEPLEMLRLAPSASNRQPWRVVAMGKTFHLYLVRSPGYARLAGDVDMQRMDMGIAMCHFELGCREKGLAGKWIQDEPGLDPSPEHAEYIASWSHDSA